MDATSGVAAAHFGSTLLVVGGMQVLKNAKWFPLIKEDAVALNRTVSVIVAFLVQIGITVSYTPNPLNGTHNLLFVIPSGTVLLVGLFHWASQYIYQETGYQVLSGLLALKTLAAGLANMTIQPGKPIAESGMQVAPVVPAK
jgi:hypothetical protein